MVPIRSYLRSVHRAAPTMLLARLCSAGTFEKGTSSTTSASTPLPSSLQGPPVSALVPPGKCQFNSERQSAVLLERIQVSPTSSVLRFALPDKDRPLDLSTCACILAHANVDGDDVTRPYTPISTSRQVGSFDLLVKNYGETAKMSRKLHEIQPGDDSIHFTHIDVNVKLQAPFRHDFIGMLVGGTGITPMIQALHAILGDNSCTTKVCMLYGSRVRDDILAMVLLHRWAKEYPDRFTCIDVLSDEPSDSDWSGHRGYIDRKLIEQSFPPPSTAQSIKLLVCGPPAFYDVLSGPRNEPDRISGMLGEIGYTAEQVYKF
jgi:cytochrome-b5 reductase